MASPFRNTNFGGTLQWTTLTTLNNLELIDLNWSGAERPAIDTTHYGSGAAGATEIGNADFILGDVGDGGTFEIDYHFNPDKVLPLSGAVDTVTITFKAGATWVFQGGITNISGAFPMRDKMVFTVTVKVCGPIAVTAAA